MARRPKTGRGAKPAARPHGELPSKEEILAFMRHSRGTVGKREISKAFGIKGGERVMLKALLAEMAEEGMIAGSRKELRAPGALPPVAPIEIIEMDSDGELVGEPIVWNADEGPRPKVLVRSPPAKTGGRPPRSGTGLDRPLGVGDHVLAQISRLDGGSADAFAYVATPIKRLPREQSRLVGIYRKSERGGGLIGPVDKKNLREWQVAKGDEGKAEDGDLVRYDIRRRGRFDTPQARIVEVYGNPEDERRISLIAIHAHGIPDEFPDAVLGELDTLPELKLRGREDLRGLPLLTIDPVDARDHDDAVHAEPDTADDNRDGHIVTVAIADVAHYVRPGSRLDREARVRGNSCYFPDRVVPMLPERISNDLCSLREGEDRPCLAVRMRFDKNGNKLGHMFMRAMMRSAVKLSYQEAQAVFDGAPGEKAAAFAETALMPLWRAYESLKRARERRGPLDLDLPERKVILGEDGRIADIVVPPRLEAHRLIEEFMIQANVAAAETLESRKVPCVYRVHDQPSKEKLAGLRDFLETLDLKLAAANVLKPEHFNTILDRAKTLPVPQLVSEVVLRAQSQAEYAVENIGHFGLNLRRYAHFTSPIRRYADLLVHRGLVSAHKFGPDGLPESEHDRLADVAQAISDAERRAMAAERDTVERMISAYLSHRIGATFSARISGVVKFGLFVRLDETGADGFVPASSLGDGAWYEFIEELRALVSQDDGLGYRLGDAVSVRLVEAVPMAGALRFEMLTPPSGQNLSLTKGYRGRTPRRGGQRPAPRGGHRGGPKRGRR